MAQECSPRSAAGPTDESGGLAAPLVLVIDDEPEVRSLVTEVLKKGGFRTAAAADADQVGELARQHRPVLILLDVLMPGVDGYTALVRLNADPATRDIPVITVTGQGAPIYRTLSSGMGARAHLSKPFSGRQLLAAVREVLEPDSA